MQKKKYRILPFVQPSRKNKEICIFSCAQRNTGKINQELLRLVAKKGRLVRMEGKVLNVLF